MELFGLDGLHLALRWFHVVAVITWIGHAYFFNWLDRGLRPVHAMRDGESIEGELWMVHSGGFYRVEKLDVAPRRMPEELHWFRWEAALSLLSGLALLFVTYYTGGGALLVDSDVSDITGGEAQLLGIAVLFFGWLAYDLLWATSFAKTRIAPLVGFGALIALAYALSAVMSGRAAYIHVGGLMGTIMVANVWRRIVPAQNALLAATKSGGTPDPALGKAAKDRSIHNNYMSLPVVFVMISNHFWWTFGHRNSWIVLGCALIVGVGLRHLMNRRLSGLGVQPSVAALVLAALFAASWVLAPEEAPNANDDVVETHESRDHGAPAQEVDVVTPVARGRVSGVMRLDDLPPVDAELELSGECVDLARHAPTSDVLRVQSGLLAGAVIWLEGDGLAGAAPAVPTTSVTLDQEGCRYVPRVLGLRAGQTLEILNSDPLLHNVHGLAKINREFNRGMPAGSAPIERSFRRGEAMVRVKCDVHPWMGAWVGVFDHPWFAVTDDDGHFALDDVPVGTYHLHVWHELFGEHEQDVVVTVDGAIDLALTPTLR